MLITKKTAEGHSLTALINRQLQGWWSHKHPVHPSIDFPIC